MAADADGWAIRNQLRKELRALLGSGLFYAMPTPDSADLKPPVSIHLKPSGVAVAARLYEQFGDYLDLRVGPLPYPIGTGDPRAPTVSVASTVSPPFAVSSPISPVINSAFWPSWQPQRTVDHPGVQRRRTARSCASRT